MDSQMKNIGVLIREERIRRGMTLDELGEKVGIKKSQLSKIERGISYSINTSGRIIDALGLSARVTLVGRGDVNSRVVGYTVAAINEFAKAHKLTTREASNYLNRFKGLDFLQNHYDSEHLLSFEDSVQDLTHICFTNGGGIK